MSFRSPIRFGAIRVTGHSRAAWDCRNHGDNRSMTSFSFGSFELDTDRRLLLSGGNEIHISRKAYELLRVLLDRAPKAMSKQELHDLIWPETFVSDTTLPGVIAELRNALGDDAHEPRYIRTVHG